MFTNEERADYWCQGRKIAFRFQAKWMSVPTQWLLQLMIHLGQAATSKGTIILEQCGKNKGYKDMDICGFCPEDNCCLLEGPERIESIINMKRVWKTLRVEGVDVIFSRDAGRYLCDYIYYTSLYYGSRRAVFIHVPPLTKLVTAESLGNMLQKIILEVLKQCKPENM
ncbi:hypothetical protein JD844_014628 [Phrynosoma platyrhinos]|uniref:Pyroglutamyl-peptidase 1-like protein n=1 Tax=Phrynosoma platyrhinos TaxID=52577 RepID=A0ABQ7SRV1_PHRPL|nr:hypothetical protein JD844_014628 [Phrynosoma platyrhinos]